MNMSDLSPELAERVKACRSVDEVLALAKEQGYELSDRELDVVSGGGWGDEVCWSNVVMPDDLVA